MQSSSPKKPFVILVTSTLGGSGRSLIASALATYLTKFGAVALVGDDLDGRGYFGKLVSCNDKVFSPAPEIIVTAANRGYHLDRLRLIEQIGDAEPLSERLEALKPFHQFVILCAKSRLESTGDLAEVSTLAAPADLIIPVYRQTERSHCLTTLYLHASSTRRNKLCLPVVNFLSNSKEVDLGSKWTGKALESFGTQFKRLLKSCPTLHLPDPETLFHGTAMSYVPALSYGACNPMFKFTETATGTPANAVGNIASIVLAAAS